MDMWTQNSSIRWKNKNEQISLHIHCHQSTDLNTEFLRGHLTHAYPGAIMCVGVGDKKVGINNLDQSEDTPINEFVCSISVQRQTKALLMHSDNIKHGDSRKKKCAMKRRYRCSCVHILQQNKSLVKREPSSTRAHLNKIPAKQEPLLTRPIAHISLKNFLFRPWQMTSSKFSIDLSVSGVGW